MESSASGDKCCIGRPLPQLKCCLPTRGKCIAECWEAMGKMEQVWVILLYGSVAGKWWWFRPGRGENDSLSYHHILSPLLCLIGLLESEPAISLVQMQIDPHGMHGLENRVREPMILEVRCSMR